MISISGTYWEEFKFSKRSVDKIKVDNSFSEILSKIILMRAFTSEEIFTIKNNVELSNPFLKNFDYLEGYKIFENTIKNKGKIIILGDYDVDGIVSTSLMIKFLEKLNIKISYFIPNRIKDGYGANLNTIKKITVNKPDLIIMLDCGSNSHEAVDYLNDKKIKSIIVDHHAIFKPYPKANCIINPHKNTYYSEYKFLCSGALVYFFIDFYLKKKKINLNFEKNLILVLLSIVCDVMPLRFLNRVIAKNVLKSFDLKKNFAFRRIFEINKIKRPINIDDLGYLLGPIINCSGRIGNSSKSIDLLTSKEETIIENNIHYLINLNEKRKVLEERILKDIDLKNPCLLKSKVIVIYKKNLNEGLIGIIAGKLKEYFNKPCLVLTNSKNIIKGSARSTNMFNIGKFLKKAIDNKIILTGGGHNLAGGLTLKKENIDKLIKFVEIEYQNLNKYNQHKNIYLSKILSTSINSHFISEIQKAAPFGSFNQNPKFLIENLKIFKPRIIKKKFISCMLISNDRTYFKAISFNLIDSKISEYLLNYKKKIKIIAQLNENLWNNKKSIQLNIIDVIV